MLYWVFSKVHWNELRSELGSADLFYLIPLTIVIFLHYCCRAWRWRYILPGAAEDVPFSELHGALLIGGLASNILPLRAGEFVRPFVFSRNTRFSFFQGFLSVVLERFFDLVTVLLGFAIIVPWVPGIPEEAFHVAILLTLLSVVVFLGVVCAAFFPDFCESLAQKILRLLPDSIANKCSPIIAHVIEGARVVRPIKQISATTVLTVAVWGSCAYYYILVLQMFGVVDPFLPGIAVTVIIALGVAAPSAPGFLGVFEASAVAALTLFAVKEEVAIAVALIAHAHQFIYTGVVGAAVLFKRNLSLSALRNINAPA